MEAVIEGHWRRRLELDRFIVGHRAIRRMTGYGTREGGFISHRVLFEQTRALFIESFCLS
jgi:hypothetical protein